MIPVPDIAANLARRTRVLLIGGVAVVLHGLMRNTKDIDFWIDPNPNPESWGSAIEGVLGDYPGLSAVYLDDHTGKWEPVGRGRIALAAVNGRILRLAGGDRPIDIFYHPNEVELDEFNAFWDRGTPLGDGTRLAEEIDLIVTKQLTDRPHDLTDVLYLQKKVELKLMQSFPRETYDFVEAWFKRYRSAEIAYSATINPDKRVNELGLKVLSELAAEGDPFAQERLEQIRKS